MTDAQLDYISETIEFIAIPLAFIELSNESVKKKIEFLIFSKLSKFTLKLFLISFLFIFIYLLIFIIQENLNIILITKLAEYILLILFFTKIYNFIDKASKHFYLFLSVYIIILIIPFFNIVIYFTLTPLEKFVSYIRYFSVTHFNGNFIPMFTIDHFLEGYKDIGNNILILAYRSVHVYLFIFLELILITWVISICIFCILLPFRLLTLISKSIKILFYNNLSFNFPILGLLLTFFAKCIKLYIGSNHLNVFFLKFLSLFK